MKRARSALLLVAAGAAVVALGSTVGVTGAVFSGTTSNTGSAFSAKRIFPGNRVTSAYSILDVSGGSSGTDKTENVAIADANVLTTGSWATTFSTTRYADFDLNAPLPLGTAPTGVTFDFRMLPNTSTDTACYYFEVRRASTNAVLGTYGSSGSPVACVTGTTFTTNSTSIGDATTSDIADDLRVRVYVKDSGARPVKVDLATVSGSSPYASFTLEPMQYTDASTGTATTTTWPPQTADANQYTAVSNWATSFSTSRYYRFTFPAYVPSGAVVTSATFNHSYKSATAGDTTCWYLEVYNGATLIGTHGSSGSPISCNATTSFVTDNVSINEVNTVSEANNVVVRVYVRNSGARKTLDDIDTLTLNYYLD